MPLCYQQSCNCVLLEGVYQKKFEAISYLLLPAQVLELLLNILDYYFPLCIINRVIKYCKIVYEIDVNHYNFFTLDAYRQIVDISMSTYRVPLVVDLFCYERDFMAFFSDDKQPEKLKKNYLQFLLCRHGESN